MSADGGGLLTDVVTVNTVLDAHAAVLGQDFAGYRNHVYRVLNLCRYIAGGSHVDVETLAVTAVFHDLGIWTRGTFDYIGPSAALARTYLLNHAKPGWVQDVEAAIEDHHKIAASKASPRGFAESFRRADWIDVTRGLRTFGVPRPFIRSVFATWPSAGFHRRLVGLALHRLRTHPLTPLPMVKF